MNTTPSIETLGRRCGAYVNDVLDPATGGTPTVSRIRRARQLIAVVGTLATLAQVVVWLLIAITGARLDEPWWLWTGVTTAMVVGLLTMVDFVLEDPR